MMILRDSKDKNISDAGLQTKTGRMWSASQAVKQAKDMLIIRVIIGNTCVGSQGLGSSTFKP